jgi:hypothetical protein
MFRRHPRITPVIWVSEKRSLSRIAIDLPKLSGDQNDILGHLAIDLSVHRCSMGTSVKPLRPLKSPQDRVADPSKFAQSVKITLQSYQRISQTP